MYGMVSNKYTIQNDSKMLKLVSPGQDVS